MKRVSVVVCLFTLLFFSCKHRRDSDDSDTPPMAPKKSNALSPNACATFLVDPRPSVDPGKLTVAAASASLERIDTQGKLYVSKFSAQMDPNQPGDTLYYKACNPTTSECFPGLMLLDETDVTRPAGSKSAYEYSLPSSSKPYTVEIRSCVRTDRVQQGTAGNGTRVRLPFASDDFYCGPAYRSAQNTLIVFLPREIPNTTLAGKLAKLKQSELTMNQSLYAVMDALRVYDAQNSVKSTQMSQMVASFVRMREEVFTLANSDYLDQAWAGAQKNVASKGLSLAGTSSCVSNGQVDSVLASTNSTSPATGTSDSSSPATGTSDSSSPTTGGSDSSSPATGGSDSSSPATGGSVGDPPQAGGQPVASSPATGTSDSSTGSVATGGGSSGGKACGKTCYAPLLSIGLATLVGGGILTLFAAKEWGMFKRVTIIDPGTPGWKPPAGGVKVHLDAKPTTAGTHQNSYETPSKYRAKGIGAGAILVLAGLAVAITGAVYALQLAETPEQMFIDEFNGLSNTFYKNRAAYQAQQADVVAYLSSEAQ